MSEIQVKFGKFILILGGLFLLLFVFSMIADSVNFYLFITGILFILFGTILRKKKKKKKEPQSDLPNSDSNKNRRGKYQNSRFKDHIEQEERQSRRSRRS